MTRISTLDDSAEYYHNRGVQLNNDSKFVEAISSFHLALERDRQRGAKRKSQTAATYSEIAFSFFSLQLYEEAIKYYIKLLSLEDKSQEAHIGLIRCNLQLERYGSATFFLSRAVETDVFCSETDLSEFDEIFSLQYKENDTSVKIKNKNDYSRQLVAAKNMVVSGNYETARSVLVEIPETAIQNTEKWELLGSIAVFEKKYADALDIAKFVLDEIDCESLTTQIVKILALNGLGDRKGAFASADEMVNSRVFSDYDECEKIANAMAKIGYDELCEKFYENCCRIKPNRIVMSTYLAIVKHNLGKYDEVKEIMRPLRVLYPKDPMVKYFLRVLTDQSVGKLPVEFFLPIEEEKRRYDLVDQKFTQLSTIEKAEEYIRQDAQFKEYLEWILCYGEESVAIKVGKFLVQSEDWREFFEERFLDPSLATPVKMEYLYNYLRVSKSRKVCCYMGYNYISEAIKPPRCDDNLDLQDAYFRAYTVSLVISSAFKQSLNKAYKEVVKALNEADYTDKIEIAEMGAVLAYLAQTNEFFTSLITTCETFGADYQKAREYLAIIGREISQEEDEEGMAQALAELARKVGAVIEYDKNDDGE